MSKQVRVYIFPFPFPVCKRKEGARPENFLTEATEKKEKGTQKKDEGETLFFPPPTPLGGQLRVRVFSFSFLVSFGLLRWVLANFYPGGKERRKDMQGSSRGSKKGGKRVALLCNQVLFVATCSCFHPLSRWHVPQKCSGKTVFFYSSNV